MATPTLLALGLVLAVVTLRSASALELREAMSERGWKLERHPWPWFFMLTALVASIGTWTDLPLWLTAFLWCAVVSFALPTCAVWSEAADGVWSGVWIGMFAIIVIAGCAVDAVGPLMIGGALVAARLLALPMGVSRGWWRTALATAHSLDVRDRQTRAGSALLHALRALGPPPESGGDKESRSENSSPNAPLPPQDDPDQEVRRGALDWLERRPLERLPLGASLFCLGMVAAARGNRQEARIWLYGILGLSEKAATLWERQTAAEWLSAYAASAGRWDRVADFAMAPPTQTAALCFWSDASSLVRGKSTSMPRGPRPLRPLLEHLQTLAPRPEPFAAPEGIYTLEDVLRLHLTVCIRRPDDNDGAALQNLASAWDGVIEEVPEELRPAVVFDVCDFLIARSMSLEEFADGPALVHEACRQVQDALTVSLLDDNQAVIERMQRLKQGDAAARFRPRDGWMEYMSLRLKYEKASRIVGALFQVTVWPSYHQALNNLALSLPRHLAHEVFLYLAAEAGRREDSKAANMETQNAKISVQPPAVPAGARPSGMGAWTGVLTSIGLLWLARVGGPMVPPSPPEPRAPLAGHAPERAASPVLQLPSPMMAPFLRPTPSSAPGSSPSPLKKTSNPHLHPP
jgi:hypothetical protein